MKKIALILAFLIIPCSAFGLEMLNDNAMDSITGQSGVAIAFDDIQLFLNVGRFAYIDCDGYSTHNNFGGTCSGSGAAIVIENFQMDVININAILAGGTLGATYEFTANGGNQTTGGGLALASSSCGQIPLFYDYGTGQGVDTCTLDSAVTNGNGFGLDNYYNTNTNGDFQFKPLTIDVSMELPILTQGHQNNNADSHTVGGVLIGLPTVEFSIGQLILTPTVTSQISANTSPHQDLMINDNESYGTFYMEDITFSVLSGWMEIAPSGDPNDTY